MLLLLFSFLCLGFGFIFVCNGFIEDHFDELENLCCIVTSLYVGFYVDRIGIVVVE